MNSYTISVGTGTCGVSAGADKILDKLNDLIAAQNAPVKLKEVGCIGMCYSEVLVEVQNLSNQAKSLYSNVDEKKIGEIWNQHILEGRPVKEWEILDEQSSGKESNFIDKQKRITLKNCGIISPTSLDDYESRDGIQALKKALTSMSPEDIVESVTDSGLKGRGGGGFPTGPKWKFCQKSTGSKKYLICNADEGDPGAFMDRGILESDPYSVIEGMCIAAYAIGAQTGYIYCRTEYPLAIKRLQNAIQQMNERNYLGEKILGSDFSFFLKIKEGAGAFVCGEETALMASIEGKRGTPGIRPPYPAESGLWNCPTNINNVETFATVPWIILNGSAEYKKLGTPEGRGTKAFAVTGKINKSGLVEVPMGTTIKEIVFDICGGMIDGKTFKAVQMGGPSGGCIPSSLADLEIDYQKINSTGAIMGSGGMVVVDESTCMVEMARFFLEFTQRESCGKCTSCRLGTLRMLEILTSIVEGDGEESDLEALIALGNMIQQSAQCGLGQTAPNPVLTTIKYFKDEYISHIVDKKCPAKSCNMLVKFVVDKNKCIGCTLCKKSCPTKAIEGERKEVHVIQDEKCVRCGKCPTVCPKGAVLKD